MGGNALAKFGAERVSREEYDKASWEILKILNRLIPDKTPTEIPWYKTKQSFGDMDILTLPLEDVDYFCIQKYLGSEVVVRNSTVMSVLYKNLQVDIIPIEKEYFNTALLYYSYNDLGNLMGKIYHKFGVKYGHRGLTYPFRDGTHAFSDIMVSQNPEHIFNFLGLSHKRFEKGFDTLEEIFEFVIGSKYFSTEPFQYENLNHVNRIRDKKRRTYHSFLEYIKDRPGGYTFFGDKELYLPFIFRSFEGFREKYELAQAELAKVRDLAAKFNGNIVRGLTGYEGEELGRFMAYIKMVNGRTQDWVPGKSHADICLTIFSLLDRFKGQQDDAGT